MKKSNIFLSFLLASFSLTAAVPQGYYDALEGECGVKLKKAAKSVVRKHNVVSYGDDTWDAFRTTDVRMVNGREAWWDMYSNETVYVSTGHGGLNIEHSVANSWWGGTKNDAYKDLFHLNPSNANANSRKSNYPLGEIASQTWTNGVTFIGTPVSGQGGGNKYVYEPADEYKGDFARVFMYMFTVYDDIAWKSNTGWMYDTSSDLLLKPWAYNLLLKWDREDPVGEKEINRNEAIYRIQKNRNPFIDLPGLGEYIWGSLNTTPFHQGAGPVHVAAPVFTGYKEASPGEYAGAWWAPVSVEITALEGEIRYSVDGGAFQVYTAPIEIGQAQAGEIRRIRALAASENEEGEEVVSKTVTLTLTAVDPSQPSLEGGKWYRIESASEIEAGAKYAATSANGAAIMNYTVDKTYFTHSDDVDFDPASGDSGVLASVPETAAVLGFEPAGAGKWRVTVSDLQGDLKGEIVSTSAKTVSLSSTQGGGTAAAVSVEPKDGNYVASIDFGSAGKLCYNAGAPRFTTYTSTGQQLLCLYKYAEPKAELAAPSFYALDSNGDELAGSEFTGICYVELTHPDKDARILYTLDGTDPDSSSDVYSDPIELEESAVVKARAEKDGVMSAVASRSFTRNAVGIAGMDADGFFPVAVVGNDIIAPAGTRVFDVYGKEYDGKGMAPGIYIVVSRGNSAKVIVR